MYRDIVHHCDIITAWTIIIRVANLPWDVANWCDHRLRAEVVIGLVCTELSDLMTRMSTGNWCGCRLRAN